MLQSFSEFGAKLGKQVFHTYEDASQVAESLNDDVSFVISRVLRNSLEPRKNKYDFKC